MTDTNRHRYRHRPIEVEALRWNPGSMIDAGAIVGTLLGQGVRFRHPSGMGDTTTLLIDTPEGDQLAQPGDWIVRPAGGDWAVMAAADFAERYEPTAPPGCWYDAEAAEEAMWAESGEAATVPASAPTDDDLVRVLHELHLRRDFDAAEFVAEVRAVLPESARLHDQILTLQADLATVRGLLCTENERANAAIDRETTGEEAAEEQRLTLSQALGLGTGAPWDAIRDRAAELAAAPSDRDWWKQQAHAVQARAVVENRAAILREAEAALRVEGKRLTGEFNDSDLLHEDGPAAAVATWKHAADLVRRMAAASGPGGVAGETQPETQAEGEPIVQATKYTVNCLPEDGIDSHVFALTVEYRGDGRWGVYRNAYCCLGADGTWSYGYAWRDGAQEPSGDEEWTEYHAGRDAWLDAHRFDEKTALRLAKEYAPKVRVNGITVVEALSRMVVEADPAAGQS